MKIITKEVSTLLLFSLLVGCGKMHRAKNYYYNEAFETEVQEYIKQKEKAYGYGEAHYDITIEFGNFLPPKAGECETKVAKEVDHYHIKKIIRIDFTQWYTVGFFTRENLMFHELGHCDLDLPHVDTYNIMNRKVLTSWFYRDNRDDLISELFSPKR